MQETDNLLGIPDGEDYWCRVQYYSIYQREMVVGIIRSHDPIFYISFCNLLCFSGTLDWSYAILHKASEEECLQFMAVMHPSELSDDELGAKDIYGKLFVFQSDNYQIRLVADSFDRLESLSGT
jgi:hypothetical protein